METSLVIYPLLTATAISLVVTPFVIKLAKHLGLIDDPQVHKHEKVIHSRPTPRAGGIALFISFLISMLIFLPWDKYSIAIALGGLLILIVGIIDDKLLASGKKDFSPYLRFVLQIVAASIPVMAGIGIYFVTNPFGGTIDLTEYWLLPQALAILWIVIVMNILNLGAKGVDGQLSGVTVIAAITVGALSLRYSADITQWPIIILASITAGAYLGFLPYHLYPQKIMPAFSGSNLAGYLLGILSILSTAKAGTLLVVLAVPFIDTGYVFARRILSGKMPFWGDRGHLHHRLLDYGWSKSSVAFFYWFITGILGLLALNLKAANKLYTIVGVAALVGAAIIWLTYRSRSSK